MGEKKLIVGLEVNTGNSAAEIERIRDAIVAFGQDGARNADGLTRALENAQRAQDGVSRKITEGRTVTERDGLRVIQTFEVLKRTIEATFGSLSAAPAEVQQAFARVQTGANATNERVRELTTTVHQQRDELSQAGAQWNGLAGAINQAMGPSGRIVAQFGLVTAAFSEGWNIGMKLNRLFGTDMSLWEQAVARFGSKLGVIVRDQADILTAYFNLVMGFVHRSPTEIKNAAKEIWTDVNKAFVDLGAALTKGGADWDRYAASIGIHNKVAEDAMKAAEKLREQKEELRKKIVDVTKALRDETLELQKQKAAAEDATIGISNAGSDQGYFKRQVDSVTAALEAQKAEVAALTARYGENNPLVIQAREKQQQLEQSLRTSQERYEATTRSLENYKDQQRAAEQAIEKAREKSAELQKQQAELEKQNTKLSGATAATATATSQAASASQQGAASSAAAASATEAQAVAAEHAHGAVVGYRDEQGRLHIESVKTAESQQKVATATEKVGTSSASASTSVGQAASALSTATPTIRSAGEEYERLASAMAKANQEARISLDLFPRVAAAAREVAEATDEAAGEHHAGASGGWEPEGAVGPGRPMTGATK